MVLDFTLMKLLVIHILGHNINLITQNTPGIELNKDMQLLGIYLFFSLQAMWQDVTGSTPLELCKDVVHFSTKVTNRKKKKSGVRQQNNI